MRLRLLTARLRMVARLRREGRLEDGRLLRAFLTVPRHRFVPPELAERAYLPDAVELPGGQTMTCPDFVALMVSLLELRPGARVLEVGTGLGFQAAILARLGAQVTTIERLEPLHSAASRTLGTLGFTSVDARLGDGAAGAPDKAPFDGIVLGCAADPIPPALIDQLAPGGRLVAPEGPADRMQTLCVLQKTPSGVERTEVRAAWFVPLVSI